MSEEEKYHYLLKKHYEEVVEQNPELGKAFTDPESEMYSVFQKGDNKNKTYNSELGKLRLGNPDSADRSGLKS